MMRTKFVLRLSLMVFMLLLFGCRTDDFAKKENNEKSTLKTRIVNLEELKKNSQLIAKLQSISNSSNAISSGLSRIYTDVNNGFSVDTDGVLYTEDPYGGKTYTFKITRDIPKENLENLVMVEKEDGLYETYIFEYEKEVLLNYFSTNRELKDAITEHVTITELGKQGSILAEGKFNANEGCQIMIATWVEVPGTTCASGMHTFADGDACIYWGTINMAFPAYGGHYEFSFQTQNCGGGGGGAGSPTIGTTGPHGGGGGGTGGTIITSPCAKIRATLNKPQIKDTITAYKGFAQTSQRTEKGIMELKSGAIVSGQVSEDLKVSFILGFTSVGMIHVHPLQGVAMFSPKDLSDFIKLLHYQLPTNINNAYTGMISSSGNYFVTFTGTDLDLPPDIDPLQYGAYLQDLNDKYRKIIEKLKKSENKTGKQQLSQQGREKLFFEMMKLMNLDGKVKLIKEDNGILYNVSQDITGLPKSTPCN